MADRKESSSVKAYAVAKTKDNKIRYDDEQPNEETIAAIEESRRLLKSKKSGYKTVKGLMKALGI